MAEVKFSEHIIEDFLIRRAAADAAATDVYFSVAWDFWLVINGGLKGEIAYKGFQHHQERLSER